MTAVKKATPRIAISAWRAIWASVKENAVWICGRLLASQRLRRNIWTIGLLFFAATPSRAQTCGPDVKHFVKKVDSKSPLETNLPTDKAIVYVIDMGSSGNYLQQKVSADRKWIGINVGHNSYFVVTLDPGSHVFCAKIGRNHNDFLELRLDLDAGKTYYLRLGWEGLLQPTHDQITEENAKVLLPKCKRTIFWEKGSPEPNGNSN